MARKTRKVAAKRGKKSKVKKAKARAAKKTNPARARKKARRKTIGQRISSGYHTVVDTVTGTDKLRNKMELPGTSESE